MPFTVEEKNYEIKYTINRVQMYERASKMPIMASFAKNDGSFSVSELVSLVSYGLKRTDKEGFLPLNKATEIATGLIEENGYVRVYQEVITTLQRDCGFFFIGAEE